MSENKEKKAVIFDLDGTLVHSLPDICGALNMIRARRGEPKFTETEVREHIGKGARHLVKSCFPDVVDDKALELITKEYRDNCTNHPHMGGHLYPGVKETLVELRGRGYLLAVATNKPTAAAIASLNYYLPGFGFEWVAGPERVSEKKPHPAHLTEVMEKIGVFSVATLYVGDSQVDLEVAERAGVKFLAAGFGFGKVVGGIRLGQFSDLLSHLTVV